MKFSCDQQTLLKALNIVNKAISPRITIPILKGILFTVKDNKLTMTASDMDMTIKHVIKENIIVEEEGEVVINSKKFTEIIRKLPKENITIETIEENSVTIKTSTLVADLFCISADEFPKINTDNEYNETLVFNSSLLMDMINKTSFAASSDETKGIITGVLIEIEENSINMVALDSFRMAVKKEAVRNIKEEKVVIEAKILNEICKILSETEEEEDVIFKISKKKAQVSLNNTEISLRLLEGEFIRYRDVLPKEEAIKVIVNKEDLINSIERASLIAEKKNNLIRINIKNNLMSITSRSEEGSIKEDLIIDKTGDDIEIGFNSKYFIDALKVIDDEEIKIIFNSSISPALILPVEGDDYQYLILAVRISSI